MSLPAQDKVGEPYTARQPCLEALAGVFASAGVRINLSGLCIRGISVPRIHNDILHTVMKTEISILSAKPEGGFQCCQQNLKAGDDAIQTLWCIVACSEVCHVVPEGG